MELDIKETTKILLVDDEPDVEGMVQLKFRKQIKSGAYHFIFAGNGIEALEKLRENPDIDIVISDINMPEMDGLTLLNRLNKLDRLLKAIIISAYSDMSNIRAAMNRGAYDFVTKPINFNDLEITIDKTRKSIAEIKQNSELLNKMEESLKEVLARNSSIVNTAIDGIISFDSKGVIETVNPSAIRMFGYTESEMQGQSFFGLITELDPESLKNLSLRPSVELDITGKEIETLGIRKNGNKFPVDLSISEFEISNEKTYTAIIRDGSLRKQAEKLLKKYNETLENEVNERTSELNKLNEEKNEILNIVAHDLKNPLSNIKLLAKLLLETGDMTREEVNEFSNDIILTTDKIFDLITNLLDINAIEQGRINLSMEVFDAKELVIAQHLSFKEIARKKNINIELNIDTRPCYVRADRNAFMQVADNLLSNALKYSPMGRRVFVHIVNNNNNKIVYRVEDQGPGISPEEQEKLLKNSAS